VGRAERPSPQQAAARWEKPRNAVDLGRFDGFFEAEQRQNTGEPFRQHGFARTRRADHEHVVTNLEASKLL
jgi:hypothetical protein